MHVLYKLEIVQNSCSGRENDHTAGSWGNIFSMAVSHDIFNVSTFVSFTLASSVSSAGFFSGYFQPVSMQEFTSN